MNFEIFNGEMPYLSTDQMREVDRAMIEDFKITLVQMMENAGRNLAHLARTRFLRGDPQGKTITVMAGTGGNGGGALVCARRLYGYGAQVNVVTTRSDDWFASVPSHQLEILHQMGIPVIQATEIGAMELPVLIIDGLIGYSLRGQPEGATADLIRWANDQDVPILALDVPSGVDADTGTVYDPAIKAIATITLALPKRGLMAEEAVTYVGELYLADISVPQSLFATPSLGLTVGNLFAHNDIIRLV